jgi:hypothetical protein
MTCRPADIGQGPTPIAPLARMLVLRQRSRPLPVAVASLAALDLRSDRLQPPMDRQSPPPPVRSQPKLGWA